MLSQEEIHRYRALKQSVSELIEMVRDCLTPDQLASVEEDYTHGELLVAVEFIVDFLCENDSPVSAGTYEKIESLMVEMKSQRSFGYLRGLIVD